MTFLDRKPAAYLWRPFHRLAVDQLLWPFLARLKDMFMQHTERVLGQVEAASNLTNLEVARTSYELSAVRASLDLLIVEVTQVRKELRNIELSQNEIRVRLDSAPQPDAQFQSDLRRLSDQMTHLSEDFWRVQGDALRREEARISEVRAQWRPLEELLLSLYRTPEPTRTSSHQNGNG